MKKDEVLRLLRSSRSGYLSGSELATTLGVSRTAVWKQIKALEREGFAIDAVPSKGYRLTASPDRIDLDELRRAIGGRTIGREVRYEDEMPSTNTRALELAQQNAPEGTVVVAESQTGGKGRLGRSWTSPRGNLCFSVVLRPDLPTHKAPLVTLLGAVAVVSALRAAGIPAGIKWPNDILVAGRKVSGLLTELSAEPDRVRHIVLGIGVNVNLDPALLPEEVRDRSTSVAAATGGTVDRTRLLAELLAQLDHWYGRFQADPQTVLGAWRDLNVTLGRRVAVSGPGEQLEGVARDIDNEGRLLVRLDGGGLRAVAAGDVTIRKGEGQETGYAARH
jgi:BirA family biotin operon repressor/biotin-[acetyl-CoA-carboxylase] ligase